MEVATTNTISKSIDYEKVKNTAYTFLGKYTNGRLRLVSLNDKYEDIILDFPPAEDTHIKIFAVVGVYRGE